MNHSRANQVKLNELSNNFNHHERDIQQPTTTEIQTWLLSYLAEILDSQPDQIDPAIPFHCYGLDSSAAIVLTGDLEEWLNHRLDPTLLYDYPTVEALAPYLAQAVKSTV